MGQPSATARSTDSSELAESQMGGCGRCTGRGCTVTPSSGGRKAPDQLTPSSVQSRRSSATDSASISAERSRSWPNWA